MIRDAGLDFYYCCEPIGPEHTPEELVEQMFLGIEYGCFQHAAMRRVFVPGMPLSSRGQITELRLAQVVAVVSLATLGYSETQNIAVHEPNLIGLTAGANVVYAETVQIHGTPKRIPPGIEAWTWTTAGRCFTRRDSRR